MLTGIPTHLNFAVGHEVWSDIPDAEKEAILPVAEANDRPLGEEKRLSALLRPSELCEDETHYTSLAEDTLGEGGNEARKRE